MNAHIKRILVALDASAHSHAALEAAAALAAGLDAELLGLFVQDMELVQLAQLPFAREVGLTSAGSRALDPRSMEVALKVQAQKAKTAFEATAQRHGLQCSFRVTRGHVVTELLAASADVDLLALGTSGHMEIAGRRLGSTVRGIVTSAGCSVLIEQRTKRTGTALLLLYEDSPSADLALTRAEQLAASRGGDLVIVLTGDAGTRDRLRERVEAARRSDVRVRIVALDDGADDLRTLAAEHGCGLLMIAHDSPLLAREPELLGELGYPILLAK
jgi:nucleotide-binding universal stress UspA family protein